MGTWGRYIVCLQSASLIENRSSIYSRLMFQKKRQGEQEVGRKIIFYLKVVLIEIEVPKLQENLQEWSCMIIWDCAWPVQSLENIGSAIDKSDRFMLVIALSEVTKSHSNIILLFVGLAGGYCISRLYLLSNPGLLGTDAFAFSRGSWIWRPVDWHEWTVQFCGWLWKGLSSRFTSGPPSVRAPCNRRDAIQQNTLHVSKTSRLLTLWCAQLVWPVGNGPDNEVRLAPHMLRVGLNLNLPKIS